MFYKGDKLIDKKTKRGLLVGFTKWQTYNAYPMFKEFFSEYNVELDFQKIDEYVISVKLVKFIVNKIYKL